jgi:hypothetical protein
MKNLFLLSIGGYRGRLFVLIGLLTLKKDFNINGIRLRLVLWCLTSLDTICLSYRGVTGGGNRIHR